jgi:hypothetical protein
MPYRSRATGAGYVQGAVDSAYGLGRCWVANQAHWLAGNAKTDGNLGAQRDKLEVLA